jgi:CRP-like cAMP-binding protein
LLSIDTEMEEQRKIGWLLIGLDITFLVASIFSIVISILMLRKKFKTIQKKNEKKRHQHQAVTVVPIRESGAEKKVMEKDENDKTDGTDGAYRFTPAETDNKDNNAQDQAKPHRIRSLAFTPEQHLGNFGDEHDEARQIHDDFHIHEENLKRNTEQRQKKAKRKTQLRLQARTKLKDSKALSKIKSFSKLKENEIDEIIKLMDHLVRFKGQEVCHQHDVSDSFYIIVKGSASVTVNVEKKRNKNKQVQEEVEEEEKRPEQVEVAKIETLGFFGEGALVAGDEPELRTATVTVSSEKCVLLRLKRLNFLKLMETNTTFTRKEENEVDGEENKSIIEQMKETRRERSKSNRMMMENRDTDGDGEEELVDEKKVIKKKGGLRPAPEPPADQPDILSSDLKVDM